eukprot:6473767-Alexandrium_andersonii.AAC.1
MRQACYEAQDCRKALARLSGCTHRAVGSTRLSWRQPSSNRCAAKLEPNGSSRESHGGTMPGG